MKRLILILPILLLFSCSDPIYIYYKANNKCITRVVKGNDNYFYYGRFTKNDKLPNEYYVGKYRGGIDADFFAFISFNNSYVELIQGTGSIEKIGIDKRFYMRCGYEIRTNLDTTLYKTSSPYANCTFNLANLHLDDTCKYYYCELTGKIDDRLVLKNFIDSISVKSRFKQPYIGKVYYDKSLAGYSIRKLRKNEIIASSEGTYGNVIYINQNIKTEVEVNKANKSKVKATYR